MPSMAMKYKKDLHKGERLPIKKSLRGGGEENKRNEDIDAVREINRVCSGRLS